MGNIADSVTDNVLSVEDSVADVVSGIVNSVYSAGDCIANNDSRIGDIVPTIAPTIVLGIRGNGVQWHDLWASSVVPCS